jgi:hypothetical protein
MNTPDDESADELNRAYRSASDQDAGRPGAATRSAILAEARAATLRRTPAANDSRYAWRAIAGVAVLGVAVLLWRQADRSITPELTVVTSRPTVSSPEPASGRAAPASSPPPLAREQPTAAQETIADTAAAGDDADVRLDAITAPMEGERKEAPSRELASARAAASPPVMQGTSSQERDKSEAAAGAVRQAETGHQELLQREFPDVWNGIAPPRTVWLVIDARGQVVRKGILTGADTLKSIQPPGEWDVALVITASGSSLQLAVIRINTNAGSTRR